jgi:hypothetical protein
MMRPTSGAAFCAMSAARHSAQNSNSFAPSSYFCSSLSRYTGRARIALGAQVRRGRKSSSRVRRQSGKYEWSGGRRGAKRTVRRGRQAARRGKQDISGGTHESPPRARRVTRKAQRGPNSKRRSLQRTGRRGNWASHDADHRAGQRWIFDVGGMRRAGTSTGASSGEGWVNETRVRKMT